MKRKFTFPSLVGQRARLKSLMPSPLPSLSSWRLTAMSSVKAGQPKVAWNIFTAYAMKFPTILGVRLSRSWEYVMKMYKNAFYVIYQAQGAPGLVKYLKTVTVLIQQSLAGHRIDDVGLISGIRVSRTNRGLPRVIPAGHRKWIQRGSSLIAKYTLSISNFFRVIDYPGKLKLSTITDPFHGSQEGMESLYKYMPLYKDVLLKKDPSPLSGVSKGWSAFPIMKSSPLTTKETNFSSHPVLTFLSAHLMGEMGFDPSFRVVAMYMNRHKLLQMYSECLEKTVDLSDLPKSLGKLGTKDEAAGKVRVFAMVDPWTQWVLKPLHDWLFSKLKTLPTDGTFDQLRPLNRLKGSKELYSLDLSAATDRLPVDLQVKLIEHFSNAAFAQAWKHLLVGRTYRIKVGSENTELTYSVGQPMGALSSWAMLAVTHHFIVQVAAWRAGVVPKGTMFKGYAVLGDDIVIASRLVKDEYLRILTTLGVECGLAKSVLSPSGSGAEFAKRTFWNGRDISPIPFKELSSAYDLLPSAIELSRKYHLSFSNLLKVLGYGFKIVSQTEKPWWKMSSKVRALAFGYYTPRPGSDSQSYARFWSGQTKSHKETLESLARRIAFDEVKPLQQRIAIYSQYLSGYDLYREWDKMAQAMVPSSVPRDEYVATLQTLIRLMELQYSPVLAAVKQSLRDSYERLYQWHNMTRPLWWWRSANPMRVWHDLITAERDVRMVPKGYFLSTGRPEALTEKSLWSSQIALLWTTYSRKFRSAPAPPKMFSQEYYALSDRYHASGLPWRVLRGLFLTSASTTVRVLKTQSRPTLRWFNKPLPWAVSVGYRSLPWILLIETLVTFLGIGAVLAILKILSLIVLHWWDTGSLYSALTFGLATIVDGCSPWVQWGLDLFGNRSQSSWGLWIGKAYLFMSGLSFLIDLPTVVRDIIPDIYPIHDIWMSLGAVGGIVYYYTVSPIVNLVALPYHWWIGWTGAQLVDSIPLLFDLHRAVEWWYLGFQSFIDTLVCDHAPDFNNPVFLEHPVEVLNDHIDGSSEWSPTTEGSDDTVEARDHYFPKPLEPTTEPVEDPWVYVDIPDRTLSPLERARGILMHPWLAAEVATVVGITLIRWYLITSGVSA